MDLTRPPDRFGDRTDAARQALLDFSGPIVGLATAIQPAPGRLAGWERFDDRVTTVRIVYATAGRLGPWASVESSRWAGTRVRPESLRSAVEHHMRLHGEYLSGIEWAHGNTTVTVDGQPVSAETVRTDTGWWAAQCQWGAVEIRILAHNWDPGPVGVDTATDFEPLLARQASPPVPEPEPDLLEPGSPDDEPQREPQRALVDTVLQASLQHAQWRAEGGPVPRLPRNWSELWRAAVRRQMELTDQTAQQAEHAVRSITAHLTSLQHDAAWFHADDGLRERAIAETLLYSTGLGPDVASRPAQLAWQRRHDSTHPSDRAQLEAYWATHLEWIGAWTTWAQEAQSAGIQPPNDES